MDAHSILQVQNLSKSFHSGPQILTVLQDVSFEIPAQTSCAIVGPSGSGKTTLLGLCAGLDVPSSGTVHLAGRPLANLNEDQRAHHRNEVAGFVFQNFQLIPTLTAIENVMVPVELRGEGNARGTAAQLLQKVGLSERLHHYPVQLSGGEQQRVALARAFINKPKILFADEPTGNLDLETGQRIIEMMFEMNAAFGTTLVLITHDAELAERTDRILQLKGGQLVSARCAVKSALEST